MPALLATAVRPEVEPGEMDGVDIKARFQAMAWGDTWEDAGMSEVLVYLKGNVHIRVPECWRQYLPTEIP